jgi:probable F420-dependent oxidoreductase
VLFGLQMTLTDRTISPADLARAVEAHGFESLFLPEHTHVPVGMRSVYPGTGAGGRLPDAFYRGLDPFVALSVAAAVTARLRLGTGICLVVQRDPIVLAKQVASLDHLSGGRVLFGIGGGWNEEELRNHGTDPATRFRLMRERVLAMKQIWMRDEAEYDGRFVEFGPIWSWPKPVQQPHPPVIVAGNGPGVLRRVVAYGDGWWPYAGTIDTLPERIAELQRLAADAGRGSIPVTIRVLEPERELLERLRAAGVTRCVLVLPSTGPDEALSLIARYAEIVAPLGGDG